MPNTFELIASSTVGAGGAASIDFTSISNAYTDLCLKLSARAGQAAVYTTCKIEFNNSTTGYTLRQLFGSGSSASSGNSNVSIYFDVVGANATSTTFGNAEFYIPNYTSSNNKSVSFDGVTENNATEAYTELYAGLWSNSAAITSIKLTSTSGNFVQHSTAYLYGIVKQ